MITDYEKLVGLLQEKAEKIDYMGVSTVIKRIPDLDVEGDLDPRVLDFVLEQAKKGPDPMLEIDFENLNINKFPTKLIVASVIKKVRKQMAFTNRDITREPIKIERKEIRGENGKIRIRIYSTVKPGIKPAIVFFHGGAFIGGSVDSSENFCKALAEKAEVTVVSVDYRLAPENAYPAGLTDCFDAVNWVYKNASDLHVNQNQIAVCGDSAGANLSAVCALMDRDLGTGMIKYQALIYPVTIMSSESAGDYSWNIEEYTISNHHDLIKGLVTGMQSGGKILDAIYIQKKSKLSDPYLSPLLAEKLEKLPPALVITAEYDYLRLQGEAYARNLIRNGVKAKVIRYNGVDHAFTDKLGIYPQAEDCINEIVKDFKETLKY